MSMSMAKRKYSIVHSEKRGFGMWLMKNGKKKKKDSIKEVSEKKIVAIFHTVMILWVELVGFLCLLPCRGTMIVHRLVREIVHSVLRGVGVSAQSMEQGSVFSTLSYSTIVNRGDW